MQAVMADERDELKLELDADNLYQEEIFTDQKIGTIRRLTPVKRDGSADGASAVQQFSATANKAIQETMEQLRELRRQAASSIVVPDMGKGGMGGLGGGGKIQIP